MTQPATHHSPADRLALLYRLAQTFNSTLDLDEVLNSVIDEAIAALGAERGFVMLREPGGQLSFRVARGIHRQAITDPRFQVSNGVVAQVAETGQPLLTSDAATDQRFSMRETVISLGLRSILCAPLRLKERVTGVIYLDNRLLISAFSQADLDLLSAIGASAAIAIENARLYTLAVEKGRLDRELQMAHEVQAGLLPREAPQPPGWQTAAAWQPARVVAGDFYDFIPLAAGQLGVLIGDVSDKGMPAALFMSLVRSILRATLSRAGAPAEGIAHANRLVCADSASGMFVTLFFAQIDLDSGECVYVNAGHNPPLLCRGEGIAAEMQELARTGMALGVLEDTPYTEGRVVLSPGDLLLIYTDGITDACAAGNQLFGPERLRQALGQHAGQPAQDVLDALQNSVGRFVAGAPQFDDIAMVVVKRVWQTATGSPGDGFRRLDGSGA